MTEKSSSSIAAPGRSADDILQALADPQLLGGSREPRTTVKLTVHPGTRVADRFTIIRFIAEGGMGEVYEALDEVLGERVALKFLSQRNVGDDNVTRRFRREVQLARKVTHPNVCRLFDVFTHTVEIPHLGKEMDVAFVTMELLRGETLEDRIVRGGPMSEEDALPIVVQMCRALSAAHDVGIVHRDFKSNNVVLVPGEGGRLRAVVTDFGLARSLLPSDPSRTPLTADQLILGTAEYMSPEQIRGEPVSPGSDLYSLGVVLFEMLTGDKPYRAPNPMQLLVKRVSEPPARPRDFRPDVSELWENVIMGCLEDDPEKRPSSAREILHQLGVTDTLTGLQPVDGAFPDSTSDTWPAVASGHFPPLASTRTPGGTPAPAPPQWRRSPAPWLAAGVLLFGSLAFWASRSEPDLAPGVFSPERITTAAGLEFDPAFSPDGERFVFSAENTDGTFSLFVRNLEGTSPPRRLDTDGDQVFEPDWSPLGDRIAYHSRSRGGIWSLPIDQLGEEAGLANRLTETGGRPAFAPDGGSIAYQSAASPLLSDTTAPAEAPSVIRRLSLTADGRPDGPPQSLTEANMPPGGHGSPAWSPDGRFVVFAAAGRSASEIWAVPVEGGEPRLVVPNPANAYEPVIANDGRSIFFVSRSREVKALWRIDVDPDTMEPVGPAREIAGLGLSSVRQPALSRDGRHLIFSAYLTRSNLMSLAVDGDGRALGEPRPLTLGNDRYNRPAFAPDGHRLAYDHWKLGVDIDIFTMDLRTGESRQVTTSEGTHSHASWLPDGRITYLTFPPTNGVEASAPPELPVFAVDPSAAKRTAGANASPEHAEDGGEPRLLFTLGPRDDWPKASPDGSLVAYHTAQGGQGLDVWLRQLEGGQGWRLTFHESSAGFPCWSPDSRQIAYQVRKGNSTELWIVPVDGGEPRALVTVPGHSWPYGFSPDGERVVYAAERDSRWNLEWISIETGEIERLTRSRSLTGYVRYPTWSPLGDRIVYERSETTSDLFVVRNFF